MIVIPPDLLARFESALTKKSVPNALRHHYKKWLRYYLDFCQKYHQPISTKESLYGAWGLACKVAIWGATSGNCILPFGNLMTGVLDWLGSGSHVACNANRGKRVPANSWDRWGEKSFGLRSLRGVGRAPLPR